MIHSFPAVRDAQDTAAMQAGCEHRTVSKDGRIVCSKIAQGDNTVSLEACRACPARTVNCSHLRFSLSHSPHVPLVVRFSGRTEIWSDDTPELRFCNAACAETVAPILQPKACASCPLRDPCHDSMPVALARRPARGNGKVVVFPARDPGPALATG